MNYQLEINKITQWMKIYAYGCGIKGAVVGLSGGIDSSVIACLCVKAFGKENVIGVSLPCQTREDMKTDAKDLAKNLDIKFLEIPLGEAFNAVDLAVGEALYPESNPDQEYTKTLSRANVKARLRMTALYEVANEMNYLVVGTGNLSQLMIGYFTKYGDGGVDIEPLWNYYKHEVYKMAKLMPEIPEGPKTKAPSADLYKGQTDEEEIGMSYNDLDDILRMMRPRTLSYMPDTNEDKIKKVSDMIRKAVH